MYINNNGVMNIDKITLGTDTDLSNNILLSATNNTLMINNTSLTDIIKDEIKKIFTIDDVSGILAVNLGNGTKYYAPM